jgi:hypothetical protein
MLKVRKNRESIMSRLVLATIGLICVVAINLAVAAASKDFASHSDGVADTNIRDAFHSILPESGGETEDLPPPPPPPLSSCNVNTVSGVTEYFDASYEACEILVVGPSFIAGDGANISVSSGWSIDFLPGFMVEQGATLKANVCGQSLCMISEFPMPVGCHSCVDQICGVNPDCCELEFGPACLSLVSSKCGLVCE